MRAPLMGRIRQAWRRLVAPSRRPEIEREMTEEMRFHIEMEVRDLVAQGVARPEAERLARARFGGVERFKDEGRDVRGTSWLADGVQDLRFARRSLARNRGYAVVSILTLALAIGASTTIFGVINGVLLKPLPFPAPDRLFQIWDDLTWVGVPEAWVTGPEVITLRESVRSFDGFAAIRGGTAGLSTGAGEPEQIALSTVTANFFTVLRRSPTLGRAFLPEEDVPNGPRVVILSNALWRRRFAADSAIVGTSVLIDGQPRTVVGVLPGDFQFALQSSLSAPSNVDAYAPMQMALADRPRNNHSLGVVGRVRDDAKIPAALADLAALSARSDSADYGKQGFRFRPIPVRERLVREVRPALTVLMAAVALLMVIMSANLATLALARASRREREFAVRRALGAGYGRVARQVLTETTVIALCGAVLGVLLARWGIGGLLALAPQGMPRREEIRVDLVVVFFTLAIGLAVGIVMGLAPLVHSMRGDMSGVIGERSSTGRGSRLRSGLVVAQVAVSLMLLAGTGLLLGSFARLTRVDGGFTPGGAVTLTYVTPQGRYQGSTAAAYHQRVVERMRALPGVVAAGVTSAPPLSAQTDQSSAEFPESPTNSGDRSHDLMLIDVTTAGPDYFKAMGIRVLDGREFTAGDDSAHGQVAIIDEALARHYFPKGNALGRRIRIDADTSIVLVVGVVGAVRMYGMREAGRPMAYVPDAVAPYRRVTTVLRTGGDVAATTRAARAAFHEIDPGQPIEDLSAMTDVVSRSLGESRLVLVIVSAFALTALLLAAIGIYGITSTAVTARSREVCIRLAMGAQRGELFRLMIRRPLALVGGGVALGLVGTVASGALIAKLLYGVSPTDPVTIAIVTLTLLAVAVLSAYGPALRATRVNAAKVLRGD